MGIQYFDCVNFSSWLFIFTIEQWIPAVIFRGWLLFGLLHWYKILSAQYQQSCAPIPQFFQRENLWAQGNESTTAIDTSFLACPRMGLVSCTWECSHSPLVHALGTPCCIVKQGQFFFFYWKQFKQDKKHHRMEQDCERLETTQRQFKGYNSKSIRKNLNDELPGVITPSYFKRKMLRNCWVSMKKLKRDKIGLPFISFPLSNLIRVFHWHQQFRELCKQYDADGVKVFLYSYRLN